MKLIKIALVSSALLAIPLFIGYSAHANGSGDGTGYGTQPGFSVSASQTECYGHGSFGYFGKEWNLGNDVSGHYPGGSSPGPGADGTQTGINNSNLCGNPQN